MVQHGRVTVAGKALMCHHCGHGEFEVRRYHLQGMIFAGGVQAGMCTACHFVHTFRANAEFVVE